MSFTVPTVEPKRIAVGDTWTWKIYLSDYLPTDGWTLTYALVIDGAKIAITASDNGDGYHLVSVAAATTAAYTAGMYAYQKYVTHTDNPRHRIGEGHIEALPNYAVQTSGYDARTHIKSVLDALETVILGTAAQSTLASSIGGPLGRSLTRVSHSELIATHERYKRLYADEVRKERMREGLGHSGRIQTRF